MARIKTPTLASRAEFDAAVANCVRLQQEVELLNAREAKAAQRIVATYAEKRAPLLNELKAQAALAEKYADDHRDELLTVKDKKSADIGPGIIGYKIGNPTTKHLSKTWTKEKIIEALKSNGLGAYVATEESIAKSKVLADRTKDEKLGVEVLTNDKGKPVALSVVGLTVEQDETFYIEPKPAATSTIKAEAMA